MHASTHAATFASAPTSTDEKSPRHKAGREPGAPLDIEELASLMRVSTRTVRNLIKTGLPHLRMGKKLRFIPAEVLAWCSSSARPTAPPDPRQTVQAA